MKRVNDLIWKYYADVPLGLEVLLGLIKEAIAQKQLPILDAGCGRHGIVIRRFGPEARVFGMDLGSELPSDLPVVSGDLASIPFRDASFSFVFCRSVFEHLVKPEEVLSEFHRILKPGGRCAILTPNRYDYSSVVAALTPQAFHDFFVHGVYGENAAYDTYPVLYRANTPRYYRRVASQKESWTIVRISGLRHYPANLAFSRILFRMGVYYDKFIAKMNWTYLQPSLLIVIEKPRAT
jgi:ubiquinone/menaquinone biosynthesis C-methylase UbiE